MVEIGKADILFNDVQAYRAKLDGMGIKYKNIYRSKVDIPGRIGIFI